MKKTISKKKFSPGLFFIAFCIITAVFSFLSCVSHPALSPEEEVFLYPETSYIPDNFEWKKVTTNQAIEYFDFRNPELPLVYHAVKINLKAADLKLACFPDNSYAGAPVFKSIRTKDFAEKSSCAVAINASPFTGKNHKWDLYAKLGKKRCIVGIHIADGIQISPPNPRYAALSFTKEKASDTSLCSGWKAEIINSQSEEAFENCDFAFGGFYVVLKDGIIQNFKAANHDSRTGAGLSEDGKYLFLLVAEGERASESQGLSFQQCARIFKAMGCSDAMEFDGGGSSELCLNGKSILSYPNHRYQANSFGFSFQAEPAILSNRLLYKPE